MAAILSSIVLKNKQNKQTNKNTKQNMKEAHSCSMDFHM